MKLLQRESINKLAEFEFCEGLGGGSLHSFLQWRKNMFSRKEIMFWVLASVAGITLAYACRLEAMV